MRVLRLIRHLVWDSHLRDIASQFDSPLILASFCQCGLESLRSGYFPLGGRFVPTLHSSTHWPLCTLCRHCECAMPSCEVAGSGRQETLNFSQMDVRYELVARSNLAHARAGRRARYHDSTCFIVGVHMSMLSGAMGIGGHESRRRWCVCVCELEERMIAGSSALDTCCLLAAMPRYIGKGADPSVACLRQQTARDVCEPWVPAQQPIVGVNRAPWSAETGARTRCVHHRGSAKVPSCCQRSLVDCLSGSLGV